MTVGVVWSVNIERKDAETARLDWKNLASAIAGWIINKALEVGAKTVSCDFLCCIYLHLDFMTKDAVYRDVFFSDAARRGINTGWGLVRDFVNMFYVLILVFLAIATILRVNKFSDKKLLISVLLSAVLVNFSKPISLFIIDVSQLAMNFFMQNMLDVHGSYSSTLANQMGMGSMMDDNYFKNSIEGALTGIIEAIFFVILAVMMLMLAVALVVRLVAFWVLIILSPLAFFGLALPGTAVGNLFSNWLNKMTYWAFFGPVLLFFLWVAIVMINALRRQRQL